IPYISQPGDRDATILGLFPNFLYLGPYFNLLPVVAVALMIVQQSLMTPPAMDEQQRAQMKMMKYMMVIFGLMFYKVAAGLCIYFIASSLWGFAERKLLPKSSLPKGAGGLAPASAALRDISPAAASTPTASAPGTVTGPASRSTDIAHGAGRRGNDPRRGKPGRNRKRERGR